MYDFIGISSDNLGTFFCEFIQPVWNCDARLFLVVCIFSCLTWTRGFPLPIIARVHYHNWRHTSTTNKWLRSKIVHIKLEGLNQSTNAYIMYDNGCNVTHAIELRKWLLIMHLNGNLEADRQLTSQLTSRFGKFAGWLYLLYTALTWTIEGVEKVWLTKRVHPFVLYIFPSQYADSYVQ